MFNLYCRWAFRMFDGDNAGVIKRSEMTDVVSCIYNMLNIESPAPMEDVVADIFKEVDDTEEDGVITEEAFANAIICDFQLHEIFDHQVKNAVYKPARRVPLKPCTVGLEGRSRT